VVSCSALFSDIVALVDCCNVVDVEVVVDDSGIA